MQTKKTAPPWITNSTKQQLQPISSINNAITKYKDCSCALACPATACPDEGGRASGRAWFFWYFLHQGKRYSKPIGANKRKKIELRKGVGSNRKLKVHPHSKNLYDRNTSPASGGQCTSLYLYIKFIEHYNQPQSSSLGVNLAHKTNVSSTFVYKRKLQCHTKDSCTILLKL